MRRARGFALLGAMVLCVGCGGGEDAPTPAAPPPAASRIPAPSPDAALDGAGDPGGAATVEARQIFDSRCVTCHGPRGAGDGPGSAALQPPPRNFQDPDWQSSVSDEHIEQIVQYGGAAVGLSPTMPGNPDLMAKPAVVTALRVHIRSLAAP